MDSLIGKIALAVLRHAVGSASAGLVVAGYLTKDQDQQAIGAVMTLITLGFSIYDKIAARGRPAG